MRFRDRITRFMRGRNGPDRLSMALLVASVALVALNSVISLFLLRFRWAWIFRLVAGLLEITTAGLAVYRVFSTNIAARRRENEAFLRAWDKVKGFFRLQKNKWRDRKTHVYRKCPVKSCGATLRLPKQPGVHTVRCPKCGERFQVRI